MVATDEVIADERLQRAVVQGLYSDPELPVGSISVQVKKGIVTLTGMVDNRQQEVEAEDAVFEVKGVRALVTELQVRPPKVPPPSDRELRDTVAEALSSEAGLPCDQISVKVGRSIVVLEGTVEQEEERRAAELAARRQYGVREVLNFIAVEPPKDE